MLPFHKRARANSSIEIATEDLEPIELPMVRPPSRPPSVRPAAGLAPRSVRPNLQFASFEDELTIIRRDKRLSSSPPPSSSASLRAPRIPREFVPSFDDENVPTHVARPLLSMSSSRRLPDDPPSSGRVHWVPPPPPSTLAVDSAPMSTHAVDANASGAMPSMRPDEMSMSLSGSTDFHPRSGLLGWVAVLAVGVAAGVFGVLVLRGEGLSAAAAFVDPSRLTADVKAAAASPAALETVHQQGAPVVAAQPVQSRPAAAVPQQHQAPSCVVETAPVQAPVAVAQPAPPKVEAPRVETRTVVVSAPAPARFVRREAAPAREAAPQLPASPRLADVGSEPAPAPRPAAKKARRGDDVESASAADALAKAQLEAALGR